MIHIYYMEDDEDIADAVKDFLASRGYKVFILPTIAKAKEALRNQCPDLVLADWNMPDGDGTILCRWIRANFPLLPVIFLTVREDAGDIICGFQNGADDYVVKPFELEVLLMRIEALLRRTGNVSKQYLSCGSISLDQKQMQVFNDTKKIHLTPSEYQLLLYLLQHKGTTVARERLLEKIWDNNGSYVNDNTLTVTMKRLREKLCQPSCLKTVRSFGYRMEDNE